VLKEENRHLPKYLHAKSLHIHICLWLASMLHLSCNIDTNYEATTNNAEIFETISRSDIRSLERLIAEKNDVNVQTTVQSQYIIQDSGKLVNIEKGSTPLHLAVVLNREDTVRILLTAGARLDSVNEEGNAPIHIAVINDNSPIVSVLIDAGCPIDLQRSTKQIYNKKDSKKTASSFPELNSEENVKGQTPLMLATSMGNGSMVDLLVKRGANINAKTSVGLTALHAAASTGQNDIATLLIARGANIKAQSISGITPLHMAAEFTCDGFVEGQVKIINLLIEKGADINAKDCAYPQSSTTDRRF